MQRSRPIRAFEFALRQSHGDRRAGQTGKERSENDKLLKKKNKTKTKQKTQITPPMGGGGGLRDWKSGKQREGAGKGARDGRRKQRGREKKKEKKERDKHARHRKE